MIDGDAQGPNNKVDLNYFHGFSLKFCSQTVMFFKVLYEGCRIA